MKIRFWLIVAICVIAAMAIGCGKKEEKKELKRIINVKVQPVQKQMLRQYIEAVGSFEPNSQASVSAEIDGVVKNVFVQEGAFVKQGQVLAQVDDTDYKLELKRAESALKQALASFENAKLELARKRQLFEEQLITRQHLDDLATRHNIAEYEVDRARSAVELAQQKLSRTKILSPISGFVREKKINQGDFVRYGTATFLLQQNNPIKLTFTVNERDINKVKHNNDVHVSVDSMPEKDFRGKISIIYPGLDEKTRSLQIQALVDNPDNLLKPGQFAKVIIYTSKPEPTLLVPVISLIYEGNKVSVFTVKDNQAKLKQVTIGQKFGDLMQIKSGITENDQVVYIGQQNLTDGVQVNVAR